MVLVEYNIRSDAVRWQISNSIKVIAHILMLALIISEILTFRNVDLENVGRGHGVYHSQWSYSMTYINVYKSHT